ncbi:ATP-binding protein [Dehalobacterium formicoaceticum]|uniref:histidine kinase n=1 Tax=Dehalobacterium formicoaceticum TaxID=51515 RepID=A0ABT1Y7K5_9FIRM|nr:PAS domain-containing sensor histidine kinase [Dehalobacterium formicoaceticum]MCR6545666.1 ATP-binding protein [Dehalobacterium formicoaceticum]
MEKSNYQLLFESTDEGISILEKVDTGPNSPINFKYILTNPAFDKITGLTDIIGKTINEVLPDMNENTLQTIDQLLVAGQSARFEAYDKALGRWFSTYAFPIGDPELKRIALIFNDISALKESEKTVIPTQERQRFMDLLEMFPFKIGIFNPAYQVLFSNQAFRERFGESDGQPCHKYIWGLDKPCSSCQTFDVFETNKPNHWLYATQDGSVIDVHALPFADPEGSPLVMEIIRDITEQINMEEGIARLDRLNLVGEMAASIGHEIRNPMTSVRGFLQLLGAKSEYQNDRQFFDLMIEELDRANSIITEYLSMAKDKKINLQDQHLDDLIETIYPMILADANLHEINVFLELKNPPAVLIDGSEIKQMILNLVRNGMESMDANGKLTIGTFQEGNESVLFVQDEGTGLPPEIIENLGRPFVTTKEGGTGLGLAICYSIAARHNAKIRYRTGSRGTTFYVHFPLPGSLPGAQTLNNPSAS